MYLAAWQHGVELENNKRTNTTVPSLTSLAKQHPQKGLQVDAIRTKLVGFLMDS